MRPLGKFFRIGVAQSDITVTRVNAFCESEGCAVASLSGVRRTGLPNLPL
jgi:hypothetical protein